MEANAFIKALFVGLGGFVGALARFGLVVFTERAWRAPIPIGTLSVNLIGCFLIGAMSVCWRENSPVWLFWVVGVLGGFTTFSAFGREGLMVVDQSYAKAAVYVGLHVFAGLGSVWLGRWMGRMTYGA